MLRSLLRSGAAAARRSAPSMRQGGRLFSDAAASSAPSGPPFKKYLLITTGIMFGIPGAIGGVFIYNLKTDDEFYSHFNGRYPDLIAAINEYFPLDESEAELANREDIGDVGDIDEIINETVTVVAELKSGEKVKFQVKGSASQQEIEKLALQQAKQQNDRVVAVTFAEEGDEDSSTPTLTTVGAWPPAPRVTWGSAAAEEKKEKKTVDSRKELLLQIQEIEAKQAALEESKYAGRDIDEADEEIAELEQRKLALKEKLPRKRFLYIF